MLNEVINLISSHNFMPHGFCISWSKPLLAIFAISDLLIFGAYLSIPIALLYFNKKSKEFPFPRLLLLFALFIGVCGFTHLIGAIVLWLPIYTIEALVKAITALISVLTAVSLWPAIPKLLMMPSPTLLSQINADLHKQITERQRIEDELRIAKTLLEENLQIERITRSAIVEFSKDAIISCNLDGQINSWNPSAAHIFGYHIDEVIGQAISLLTPPELVNQELDLLQHVQLGERGSYYETERMRKDGGRIDVTISASPICDTSGQIIGISKIVHDITDQIKAEAQLIHSEMRFRRLFDDAPLPMVLITTDGISKSFNQRFVQTFGYTLQDLPTINEWWPLAYPDEAYRAKVIDTWNTAVAKALATQQDIEALEYQVTSKDNTLYTMVISGISLGAEFLVTFFDVTERKLNEDKLRKFSSAIEQSSESIVFTDLAGNIEYVNEAYIKKTGFSREELIGRNSRLLQSGNTPTESYTELWQTLQKGETWKGEFYNRQKDGDEFIEFAIISPIRQTDDTISHYVAVKEDITEKKRMHVELSKYREHLESLVEQRTAELKKANRDLTDTQFAMDSAGIGIQWINAETGRILYVNHYAAQILGYTTEEMQYLSVTDINPNYPAHEFKRFAQEIIEQGLVQLESVHKTKDGQFIPVELTIYYLVGREDAPARFFVFLTDISARKTTEAALIVLKEKAEAANRAKSAFLANMSHEIRTPLNAILGLAHLLRKQAATPALHDGLEQINSAGRHLLTIINDILDLSKIDAGKLELESVNFPLKSILNSVHALIAEEANAKQLKVEVECNEEPLWLKGDPTRLRQALLNLASNAIKFTERGTISIHAQLEKEDVEGVMIRFEVRDTGIGIAPEQLLKLFAEFEQADASTTRKHGGTGLGLFITRRLAQLMGGEAGAVSKLGHGSTFWFSVHLSRGEEISWENSQVSSQILESQLRERRSVTRILLVEDNLINQEVALRMLQEVALQVEIAENGKQAVAKACTEDWDLILMDMQMPEMNGVEATRAIRCLPGMQNVPILAMTANAFDENQRECMTAGMNDFISKPVDPEVLYATLLKWLPSEPITIEQNLTSPVNNKLTQHTQSGATAHSALLLDLTGIDIAKGLKFWDNETAYRAYLTKYLNNYKNAGLDIAEMLSRNDIENAAGLTHKIKGVTGYLGLPEVEQCIVQLNELFHAGIATRDSAEALQKAIDEVCVSAAIWESAAAKDDYQGLI